MNLRRNLLLGCVSAALLSVSLLQAAHAQGPDESAIAAAKQRGKLIVGVKYDYPPFGFVDEKRQVVGFEVDLAHELAKELLGDRNKIDLVEVSGPNRIPFLLSKKVDLVIATLTITPERAKTISFSDPFYTGGYSILTTKSNNDIKGMPDLAGKRVVITRGSTIEPLLAKLSPAPQILKMELISELYSVMQTGRADAAVQDVGLLKPFVATHPAFKLAGGLLNEEHWGVGMRKGDEETRKFVNGALAKFHKDGQFDAWLRKWSLN